MAYGGVGLPANINWLDITALVLILVCAIDGLVKGFIISVFNISGFFIAIYGGKVIAPYLSEYIYKNSGIDEALNKYFIAKASVLDTSTAYLVKAGGVGGSSISGVLTSTMILVLSFFIIFIVIRIVLSAIASMLDSAAKLPVIKQFNRMGGLLFGAAKGIAILYILFAVLTPVIPLFSSDNPFISSLNESVFTMNFYRYNIIIPWIRGQV